MGDPQHDNVSNVFLIIHVKTIIFDNIKADWWVLGDR